MSIISPTFAGFTSQKDVPIEIQAGTWPVPWPETNISITDPYEIESCIEVPVELHVHNDGPYDAFPLSVPGDYPEDVSYDDIEPFEDGETFSIRTIVGEGTNVITATDGKNEVSTTVTVTCPEPEIPVCSPHLSDSAAAESEGTPSCQPPSKGNAEVIEEEAEESDDSSNESPVETEKPDDKKEETNSTASPEKSAPTDNPTEPASPAKPDQPSQPAEPAPVQETDPAPAPAPEPTAVKEGE